MRISKACGSCSITLQGPYLSGERMHYLYLITRDDGEQYVGVTANVDRRAWQHKNGYGSSHLQNRDFTIEIIEQGDTDYIYSIEDSAIKKYNCSLNKIRGGINAGGLVGSKNGRSKLCEDDIIPIRDLLLEGKTQQDIGDLYGVSRATIAEIARGTGWSHVIDERQIPSKRVPVDVGTREKLKLDRQSGLSIQAIADKYNIKYATVYSHVRDIVAGNPNNRKLSPEKIASIIELRKTGVSWDKIAKQLGVGSTTARRYCKEAGI